MCESCAIATKPLEVYQRSDPTQTLTLRHKYAAQMRKRFRNLRGMILDAIITKDVFGIADGNPGLQSNELFIYDSGLPSGAFDFPRLDKKVQEFMNWLQDQVDREILEVTSRQRLGNAVNQTWQNVFIEDSYKRGVQRATYEMGRLHFPVMSVAARGGIMAVLGGPFHADRLGLLYTRAFNELKGITTAMDQQISRVLTQGMGDGDGPRLLARKLNAVIRGGGADLGITDALGRFIPAERRAEVLARTEVIRAHHQAMIQEFKNWKVQGITVMAEFRTAGDNRVCYECSLNEGKFYTLQQAENLIPVHPQCRCMALPARPEDVAAKQAEQSVPNESSSVEQELTTSPVTDEKFLGTGVNDTSILTLRTGAKGVFKKESGERWGIRSTITNKDFTLAEREVLASRIDTAMNLNRVPKTVFRTYKGERGSLQLFVDDAELVAYMNDSITTIPPEEMWKASVFDVLIGNTDRHGMNMMVKNKIPVLIDNGYSFPNTTGELRLLVQKQYKNSPAHPLSWKWKDKISDNTRKEMIDSLENLDFDGLTKDLHISNQELGFLKNTRDNLVEALKKKIFLDLSYIWK